MSVKSLISDLRFFTRKYPYLHSMIRSIHVFVRGVIISPIILSKVLTGFKNIRNRKKNRAVVWFVNVPSHANMGDQAMAYATRRLVSEQFPEYVLIELTRDYITFCSCTIDYLKQNVMEKDIIIIQGGYTSTDKSPNEKAHRLIASSINNKIIFMPQTVKYSSDVERDRTAAVYNNHGNIIFFCRDIVSYNLVKDYFTNIEVLLYPDIVSSLIGREHYRRSNNRNGILLVIREDSEKHYSTSQIADLYKSLQTIATVDRSDLMLMKGGQTPDTFHCMIDSLLEKMSAYEIIITDRFHGILFSIISETKVIAIDSIDYKVREGAKMFSKLLPGSCEYAKDISNVPQIVNRVLNETSIVHYDTRIYDKFYKEFRSNYVDQQLE